jgi:hypothetical protein
MCMLQVTAEEVITTCFIFVHYQSIPHVILPSVILAHCALFIIYTIVVSYALIPYNFVEIYVISSVSYTFM